MVGWTNFRIGGVPDGKMRVINDKKGVGVGIMKGVGEIEGGRKENSNLILFRENL